MDEINKTRAFKTFGVFTHKTVVWLVLKNIFYVCIGFVFSMLFFVCF